MISCVNFVIRDLRQNYTVSLDCTHTKNDETTSVWNVNKDIIRNNNSVVLCDCKV